MRSAHTDPPEQTFLPRPTDDRASLDGFRSTSFLRALRQVERFARDETATVLITGEPGTGKTCLARHVHRMSPRSRGSFLQITLSAVDDGLASSELFGHVAGAFTDARATRAGLFASASGGTLFLDEIGKASRVVQHKLLHVVEYGEFRPVGSDRDVRVNVRLVVAANEHLDDLVRAKSFLPDLLARLSVFSVRLPSLAERKADIPILVERYVRAHCLRLGLAFPRISPELLHALQAFEWPNNLRQLDATVHRVLLEADGAPELRLEHCRGLLGGDVPLEARPSLSMTMAEIDAAIAKSGTVTGAAGLLGVHRATLYRLKQRESSARSETHNRSGPAMPMQVQPGLPPVDDVPAEPKDPL